MSQRTLASLVRAFLIQRPTVFEPASPELRIVSHLTDDTLRTSTGLARASRGWSFSPWSWPSSENLGFV